MPFALIGFMLGYKQLKGDFNYWLLLLVVLCMVFARNAAMGFNRFVDREYDKKNPRTEGREIPANKISPTAAFIFVIANAMLFIVTTYFINAICFYLSPVALIVILGYSLTKRFTAICHLVLGLGLSLAPIGAYLAVTGVFNWTPLFFSIIVIFWVAGFDIFYAMQDKDFDTTQKLKSIPEWLGLKNALIVSVFFRMISIFFIVYTGLSADYGVLYWIGGAIFTALLIYQHLLVKPNDLSKVNLAFATTNGFASIIFAVFVIAELLFK